jgi:hypothetical protein
MMKMKLLNEFLIPKYKAKVKKNSDYIFNRHTFLGNRKKLNVFEI